MPIRDISREPTSGRKRVRVRGKGELYRVLHNAHIAMTHPRMGQPHQHLPGPGLGRIHLYDFGADAAGVVVDASFVFLWDLNLGDLGDPVGF